jgi:hypothetical protein
LEVQRRGFEHLFAELSVTLGRAQPRYALWLAVHAVGLDPERLDRKDALTFLDVGLTPYLRSQGRRKLARRQSRRLRRSVARFDPGQPTPEEQLGLLAR